VKEKKLLLKIKKVFCALFGHTKIQSQFFGYWYCGRCGEQLGDSLGGVYSAEDVVIIGHNCETCRKNHKKLKWHEKILVPNPFKKNA